jgi:DNA ligase (NAD+)
MSQQFAVSTFDDHELEIAELEKLGFATNPLNKSVTSIDQAWEYAESTHNSKDNLAYQIDGVVIKLKNNRLASTLGVVGKTPRGWAAIKFAGEEATTKVIDVVWQIGRSGKLTPVADLEPVELMGTTVKRATLHNYKEVVESGIHIGDRVVVHKAGDIIPEVLNVLSNLREDSARPPSIPMHCPSCNTELTTSSTGVDLVCTNLHCPAQIIGRLTYYTQRSVANIAGLSEKNIQKFVELFEITDIAELYDLPYDKIFELDGYGQKSVEKLKKSLEASKHMNAYRFLAGLGIDGVGPEVAQLLIASLPQLANPPQQEAEDQRLL